VDPQRECSNYSITCKFVFATLDDGLHVVWYSKVILTLKKKWLRLVAK
jgi:hypothetical protein